MQRRLRTICRRQFADATSTWIEEEAPRFLDQSPSVGPSISFHAPFTLISVPSCICLASSPLCTIAHTLSYTCKSLRDTLRTRGNHARLRAAKIAELQFRSCRIRGSCLELFCRTGHSFLQLLGAHFIESQLLDVFRGDAATASNRVPSLVANATTDFFGHFFGRDQLPRVDRIVFVLIEGPANAVAVKPTILIGLAVVVGIDIAINFQTVAEIAPDVDDVVGIGIGKLPQDFVVRPANDPGGHVADFLGFDRTLRNLIACGCVIFNTLLHGRELEGIGHRRRRTGADG